MSREGKGVTLAPVVLYFVVRPSRMFTMPFFFCCKFLRFLRRMLRVLFGNEALDHQMEATEKEGLPRLRSLVQTLDGFEVAVEVCSKVLVL